MKKPYIIRVDGKRGPITVAKFTSLERATRAFDKLKMEKGYEGRNLRIEETNEHKG